MAEIWPKRTIFYFGPSLNKDNMEKIFERVFFSQNMYNSPFFRKNISKEQEKKSLYLFAKSYGFLN
jgi:hypothetical protein